MPSRDHRTAGRAVAWMHGASPKEWAMIRNPYQQYRATKVETAGSVDLVVMLYQGAVKFVRLGIDALERRTSSPS
jgi:hypothetical protein